METVQTCTRTWWWCVGMYGARFAVFDCTALVLPSRSQATRNLSFFEVSPATVTTVVSTRCLTGLVRVGLTFPLNGTCANKYAHVAMVREHVWRTVCSVCATGARVARPKQLVICRSSGCHRRPSPLLFRLDVSLDWYGLI